MDRLCPAKIEFCTSEPFGCGRATSRIPLGDSPIIVPSVPDSSSVRNPAHAQHADRLRARLEARIRRHYVTVCEAYHFGGLTVQLTRVAEPDEMLERMEQDAASRGNAAPRWQPYWAELWGCSLAVCQRLVQQELQGVRVLDLGCGLGLTGTVAAARGALVTMADAAPPALLFARLNSWPYRDRVQVRRLDWRRDRLPERFPWIVGADILYDREDWPYLEAFWRAHLAPAGAVLLGEGGRSTGGEFPDWLHGRGWRLDRSEVALAGQPRSIRLFQLTK
jgi:predicted nicotinamide N-methyase